MAPFCCRRHRFPPQIIQHAIWLYLRFTLSYRVFYGGRVRQKGARTEGAADRDHAAHRAAPEGRDRLLHYVGNLDFRGLSCCRPIRAFENRAEARASGFRLFKPAPERQKARVFLAFAVRPDGQPGRSFKLAGLPEYSSNSAVRRDPQSDALAAKFCTGGPTCGIEDRRKRNGAVGAGGRCGFH
jgi:hypothetical protein